MNIKLFVEGIADEKFIKDYILEHYNLSLTKEDIIKTEGWTQIFNGGESIINAMQKNTDNAGTNLLIFDADENYSERLRKLEEWRSSKRLQFEIFLWPNNATSGDLETLLEQIINQQNAPIFDCWSAYELCLRDTQIPNRTTPLTTPARKTKIYGYLEALLGPAKADKNKIKEKHRDYRNSTLWDLNAPSLNPLNEFLNNYFQPQTTPTTQNPPHPHNPTHS